LKAFFYPSLLLQFLDPGSEMDKNKDPDKHPGSPTLLLRLHCRYLSRAEHVVNGGNCGGRFLLRDGEILLGGAAYHPACHPSMYNQYGQIISTSLAMDTNTTAPFYTTFH
jgi:hypothetical protein